MTSFLSQFLAGSSSTQGSHQPIHSFHTRSSPTIPNLNIIHPLGTPIEAPPLYSVIISPDSKPQVTVFRGGPDPSLAIGSARFSSLSSKLDPWLHGQPIQMKMSLSGNFSFEFLPMGKLKWKLNPVTGSSMQLVDSMGNKLASFKSLGMPGSGEKKLEILVPCDGFFIELIVLTAWAAKAMTKSENKIASEVVQAVAGV